MGKGENAAVSPFPTMFSTLSKPNFNFSHTFILSSADAFNLDHSKKLSLSKEFYNRHVKKELVWERLEGYCVTKFLSQLDLKIAGKIMVNPLPDNKILDWSKLKQIADDMLKCI